MRWSGSSRGRTSRWLRDRHARGCDVDRVGGRDRRQGARAASRARPHGLGRNLRRGLRRQVVSRGVGLRAASPRRLGADDRGRAAPGDEFTRPTAERLREGRGVRRLPLPLRLRGSLRPGSCRPFAAASPVSRPYGSPTGSATAMGAVTCPVRRSISNETSLAAVPRAFSRPARPPPLRATPRRATGRAHRSRGSPPR